MAAEFIKVARLKRARAHVGILDLFKTQGYGVDCACQAHAADCCPEQITCSSLEQQTRLLSAKQFNLFDKKNQ